MKGKDKKKPKMSMKDDMYKADKKSVAAKDLVSVKTSKKIKTM